MIEEISDWLFHDKVQKRKGWMQLFKDPVWVPAFNVSLDSHRDKAYKQLKKVMDSKLVSVLDFFNDPTNIFTAHEMISCVSGSTCTKFTVHINLFGGSITALHTQRHRWIFEKLDKLQITGCFCLTELGFGNNAVQMETTSTYDPVKKEFIVDCPTTLSQKYWITNGAIHANYALVFAQTIVSGKNEGVNAFLVPIRDEKLKELPGVEILDMGYKIGLNGVDNAALKFHNVRIPRENMMNRYCDVNQKGEFISDIKGIQQRFFKVTQRLLSGRLCIASLALGSLKTLIYISIKYSQQRKAVSPNGLSQTPIFQYQLQQNALIPIIARTLGLNMLHNFAKETFANSKNNQRDLLIICCVDKVLMGWHSQRSISVMRERSGGQGYLAANYFGEGIAGNHASMTAEGDNKVLMVKVVKDLLGIFKNDQQYFYSGDFVKVTKMDDLYKLEVLVKLFQMREKHLLMKLIARMSELKEAGSSNYDILMKGVSDQMQEFALSHGEKLAIRSCFNKLQKLNKGKDLIKLYFTIFAWEIILRQMPTFLLQQLICPLICKKLRLKYNQLIKEAAKSVDIIVSSLNVPTHAVFAPMARDYVKYNERPNYGEVSSKL